MLQVNYENRDSVVVVRLEGELMLESVEQLKVEFNEHMSSHKYFLFDFKGVTMIDSSGLGYIVYCLKRVKETRGAIKIAHLVDQAKLIFEITRVNSILDIYDDEINALNSFKDLENSYESNNTDSTEISA